MLPTQAHTTFCPAYYGKMIGGTLGGGGGHGRQKPERDSVSAKRRKMNVANTEWKAVEGQRTSLVPGPSTYIPTLESETAASAS